MGQQPYQDEHADDGQGQLAVVDEQTDQPTYRAREDVHAVPPRIATRLPVAPNCLATLMPSHEATARIAISPTIAASAYGHCRPTPSPNQNKPNADIRIPTTSLSEFSGTRARGPRNISPAATTTRHAKRAPRLAGTSKPPTAPRPMTMTMTSIPSHGTALNAVTIAIGSHLARASSTTLAL